MQYNLKPMLEIQEKLNQKIYQTQKIDPNEIKVQSHLCILVELMELCNETRCFNYWSKKTRGSDEAILEELADVLCFLLTEMLDWPTAHIMIDETIQPENKLQLTIRFQNLAKQFANLDQHNPASYIIFTQDLFNLGYALGYKIDQIYQAYLAKVDKNYEVQNSFHN